MTEKTLVAGRTILPSIFDGMQRITNQSDPLKFLYEAISYKPFISLFNMTGISGTYPELAGVGELMVAPHKNLPLLTPLIIIS